MLYICTRIERKVQYYSGKYQVDTFFLITILQCLLPNQLNINNSII